MVIMRTKKIIITANKKKKERKERNKKRTLIKLVQTGSFTSKNSQHTRLPAKLLRREEGTCKKHYESGMANDGCTTGFISRPGRT
jgi:hypothetical protein